MFKRFVYLYIFISFSFSQNIQLNEIVSSNQDSYYDEDGDTPDWIEIYNPTSNTISLDNWGLSDDIDDLDKWRFPQCALEPDSFLIIVASDKDRTQIISEWQTIIDIGDLWYYHIPPQEPSSNWNQLSYNHSNWDVGNSGFGYGDNDDNTELPNTISVYLAKNFTVDNIDQINKIAFHIDYDDGFVAYLNGVEFARDNILGNPPAYDQGTITWKEAEMINGGEPNIFLIDSSIVWPNEGENLISIQVHNFNINSSDLSCVPFLSIGRDTVSMNFLNVAEEINLPNYMLHSNFKIKSSGETIFITDHEGDIVDSISTGVLRSDVSIGRINEGDTLGIFLETSPGKSNGNEAVLGVLGDVTFSNNSGFYDEESIYLSINSSDIDAEIYYTLNGSEPSVNSLLYSAPILIQENKVIKATSFQDGWMKSQTSTATIILDNQYNDFPTMLLSTNPSNFFDYNTGIYEMGPNASPNYPHFGANFWENWERPIFIEVLDVDNTYFSSPGGVKIFGGWSRGQSQKSLSLFARGEYGASSFNYQFFPELEIDNFQALVLRNSGNDWNLSMLRDGFITSLFNNIDIDIQSYKPMLVYLNGQFWGLYNLREKVNEHFIASHHPVDPDEIDLIEVQTANEGSIDNYQELINFVNQSDMTNSLVFDSLSKWIDIDNHINYNIAQIFIDNRDWPGNNVKYWRSQSNSGRWRWILYDTDFGFGVPWNGLGYNFNTLDFALEDNGPEWPNPPWSTLLFRKMFENDAYKRKFVSHFSDHLNTIFDSEVMVSKLDSMAENIENLIPMQIERWPGSAVNWHNQIDIIKNFALLRPQYIRQYLESYFDLEPPKSVSLYSNEGGLIKINSFTPSSLPWAGFYYSEIPVSVEAIANEGFAFSHWNQFPDSSASMRVQVYDNLNLSAIFEPANQNDISKIVINEINYNSSDSFDVGDWVEFYNNGDQSVILDGYYFTDENPDHKYIFSDSSIIESGSYIVLAQDIEKFSSLFSNVNRLYGPFDFGLSGGGEEINLYDPSNQLIDKVNYDDENPWPSEPDGNGPTLELMHADSLNEFANAWRSSFGNGTPGYLNSVIEELSILEKNIPTDHILCYAYPNPFNSQVKIVFNVEIASETTLNIINILGESVRTFKNNNFGNGINTLFWNGENDLGQTLSTGIYFCRLKSKNIDNSIKLLYVK